MKFDAESHAAALLDGAAAQGRPDFADRAAACHLLRAHQPHGVDFLTLWPGRLEDFANLPPAQSRALALAILKDAEARARPAKAS